jgi:hypothetical protein
MSTNQVERTSSLMINSTEELINYTPPPAKGPGYLIDVSVSPREVYKWDEYNMAWIKEIN